MVTPIEEAELASIVQTDAAQYLRGTGWAESEDRGVASIWSRRIGSSNVRVLLPGSSTLLDYPARMYELLSTLAVVEQRAREDVLHDLRFPLLDVQFVRTTAPTPSGTTGLRDGYQAIKGVHDLFLAAATSAVLAQPLAVLPSAKPKQAQDFLRTVRLGPTGKGSYVLRVETPLRTTPTETNIPPREVLLHLYHAVRSAHTTADQIVQTGGLAAFEEQLANGVSANLCSALADIGGPDKRAFDITFSWAKPIPVREPTPPLGFSGQQIEALKTASKYLRELSTAETVTVQGKVIKLSNKAPDRRGGTVVIEGSLSAERQQGEQQQFSVQLPLRHYELAVEAHRSQRALTVTGRLRVTGRSPEIVSVTSVAIE